MVWASVWSDGSTSPMLFFEDGVKVNSEMYFKMLAENVLSWATETYGTHYIFIQDGAPAQGAVKLRQDSGMVQGPFLRVLG